MGRHKNCGAAVILPTAPAWSFPGKYPHETGSPGPGGGKYAMPGTLGPKGYAMGPPRRPKIRTVNESSLTYPQLSRAGPAWAFGLKPSKAADLTPGPYGCDDRITRKAIYGNSWGPPPRPRPPSAPPAGRMTSDYPRDKPLGPSFGIRHPVKKDQTPAPHDYQPFCSFGCKACDHYHGPSFGVRHHLYPPEDVPGADNYHVACSTLGAAAKGCKTGSVLDRWTAQPHRQSLRSAWA